MILKHTTRFAVRAIVLVAAIVAAVAVGFAALGGGAIWLGIELGSARSSKTSAAALSVGGRF